jgi:hypothetical protein
MESRLYTIIEKKMPLSSPVYHHNQLDKHHHRGIGDIPLKVYRLSFGTALQKNLTEQRDSRGGKDGKETR